MTTYDASTAVDRGQHPMALTPAQKTAIEKSWQVIEEDIGLLKGGIILFMRSVIVFIFTSTYVSSVRCVEAAFQLHAAALAPAQLANFFLSL